MRAGAEPVRHVSLVRQVRLQNVVGVGFDVIKKVLHKIKNLHTGTSQHA